jgi:hypothetical protein
MAVADALQENASSHRLFESGSVSIATLFGSPVAETSHVFLRKSSNGVSLSFVVSDGVASEPGVLQNFEGTVHRVAASLGGLPIQLRLVGPSLTAQKEERVS